MISFTYRVVGSGWAFCTVELDGRTHESLVSYLGDTIDELLGAIAYIAEGGSGTRISFFSEPGEDRWVFRRNGRGVDATVDLTVFYHREWRSSRPDDYGRTEFTAVVPVIELALAARAMAREVLAEYEYDRDASHRLWQQEGPFPLGEYERLNRLLAM